MGVTLSVAGLHGRTDRVVCDPLVESLVGRPHAADFHLFHGIPPVWAARAFPIRDAIGITVLETTELRVFRPCENVLD